MTKAAFLKEFEALFLEAIAAVARASWCRDSQCGDADSAMHSLKSSESWRRHERCAWATQ